MGNVRSSGRPVVRSSLSAGADSEWHPALTGDAESDVMADVAGRPDDRTTGRPDRPQRYAFLLEFAGRGFAGTQEQAQGLRTLQGELAAALADLAGHAVVPRLASRLDAGVSARLMPCVAELNLRRVLPLPVLGMALDDRLVEAIAVRAVAVVDDAFHPITGAVAKTYSYRILVRPTQPALDQRAWWVRQLDHPERLPELAARLVGRQDLRAFACLRRDDTDAKDGTRSITAAAWHIASDGLGGLDMTFTVTGSGFLYRQVRGFVGAMIPVAQGRRSLADFAAMLAGDATVQRIGKIAPPEGLTLERVHYDPEPAWIPAAPLIDR